VTDATSPAFRELSREECEALLSRNRVGRIAFSYHDHVDIEPIYFVWDDGWLYGRTGEGTKLRTLAHNRWLAVETDEITGMFDWTSVVIKGALYLLEPGGTRGDAYDHAVQLLRRLLPETLGEHDPFPSKTVVFRIHADQITGRAASTKG
jgi:nitroimidazol reductase NimA-like FMN-containing flavoprotein (pyridoxamine 5'-phosphate oxidase superfamily)